MFTIIILEQPQLDTTLPLPLGDAPVAPIERLRVNFSKLTAAHLLAINKLAWKLPRKTRTDKGCTRKK